MTNSSFPRSKRFAAAVPEPWRTILESAAAIIGIATLIIVTHAPFIAHGMCFNDPSWYFHFGRRVVDGAMPYRDYVFQVGPLPIFTDALSQKIFGSTYVASLYASLGTTIVRTFILWLIGRRLGGVAVGGLLAIFGTFDPLFSIAHNWSTPYASLFISMSGLFFLTAAAATEETKTRIWLACAGASAALVVSARQSAAVMVALMLLASSAIMLWRGAFFTRRRFVALWGGFVGGLVAAFTPLATVGALRPAIKQLFLDAPQKKAVHGLDAVLDAISGGSLTIFRGDPSYTWWSGFLMYIGLPALIVAIALYASSLSKELSVSTMAVLGVPIVIIIAMCTRFASLATFSDLPRTFLTATTTLAVFFPRKCRQWLGVEPIVAVGLGALPLASDWALEMSAPGRGWGDGPTTTISTILLALSSRRLTDRLKAGTSALVAMSSVGVFAMAAHLNYNPTAKDDSSDGTLLENRFESDHPMLRGLRVNEARKRTLDWLRATIPPGSSCFVYGNLPVLYSLLDCKNATAIDTTIGDFITNTDAEAAAAILQRNPPDFIIAHEKSWMNPPLELDLEGKLERYDGLNPKASLAMHVGLRSILNQYESVGIASEILGPELTKLASAQRDLIHATRVYRRRTKLPASPPPPTE